MIRDRGVGLRPLYTGFSEGGRGGREAGEIKISDAANAPEEPRVSERRKE